MFDIYIYDPPRGIPNIIGGKRFIFIKRRKERFIYKNNKEEAKMKHTSQSWQPFHTTT